MAIFIPFGRSENSSRVSYSLNRAGNIKMCLIMARAETFLMQLQTPG